MQYLHQCWTRSKPYRVIVIAAAIYTLLRLAVHGFFLSELLRTTTEGYDLQLYLDAAQNLLTGQNLYPKGALDYVEFVQYSPAYALAFAPFLYLPMPVVMVLLTLIRWASCSGSRPER